jgi:hypothetical protein
MYSSGLKKKEKGIQTIGEILATSDVVNISAGFKQPPRSLAQESEEGTQLRKEKELETAEHEKNQQMLSNPFDDTLVDPGLQHDDEYDTDTEDEETDESYFFRLPTKKSTMELNIAEFPIAILNKKSENITRHVYNDTITGRNGQQIERTWIIETQGKDSAGKNIGFGGPSTLQIIYELFQLWEEQNFKEPRIYIGTYSQFLRRLGWSTGKSQYEQLKRALKCIHGLHITGINSFYLKKTDEYANIDMYLFPEIETYDKSQKIDDPDVRLYITASNKLFETVKNNNYFTFHLDRELFRKLKPMEQKLALILSKYFSVYRKNQKYTWRRNIHDLANQIPILSQNKYVIRQQLKNVCNGLIEKGFPFLSCYEIKNDVITFHNNTQTYLALEDERKVKRDKKHKSKREYMTVNLIYKDQLQNISNSDKNKPFFILVAKYVPEEIIIRCISTAKQEGKDKLKLYIHLIIKEAKEYIRPHLKATETICDKEYLSDSDIETINTELQSVLFDYYVEKDKYESKNEKNKSTKNDVNNPDDSSEQITLNL